MEKRFVFAYIKDVFQFKAKFSAFFKIYSRAYRAKKKVQALLFSREKKKHFAESCG